MSTQVVDEIDQLQEELLSEGYVLILHNDDITRSIGSSSA